MNLDHPVILVMMCAGVAVAVFHAVYWGAAWYQLAMTLIQLPTGMSAAKRLAGSGNAEERVCVVVPAHNEEAQIETIARSLLEQTHRRLSVVFVLDRCTDGTLDRLRGVVGEDERCTIVEVGSCPDDWAGKPHAIWRAINDSEAAKHADLIAMIDADTRLDPRCIEASIAMMKERALDLLSLLSTLTRDALFERIAQPPATFELMRQYPIRKANASVGRGATMARRPFANGQFIMVRRESYFELGGHEAIKDSILEDVEMARRFARNGKRTGLFIADGLIRCQMYTSYDEFTLGWNRIYRESVHRDARRLRSYAWRLRVMSVWIPAMSTLVGLLGVVGLLGWSEGEPESAARLWLLWIGAVAGVGGMALFYSMLAVAYHMGQTGWKWAFTYPYGSWLVARILSGAAGDIEAGRPIRWGGRTYYFPGT